MSDREAHREHTTPPATRRATASRAGRDPETLADSRWVPDVLGAGFEQRTLPLGRDTEGPLVATLVRHLPEPRRWWQRPIRPPRPLERVDVLYVHGWSDYFFHTRLARHFAGLGARFFALDLRKYGRSLRTGQTPGFIANLDDYDAELDLALRVIRGSADGPRRLLLVGHSTGGLVLSLWAHRNPGVAAGLVLNSPWLALQIGGPATRAALSTVVDLQAAINPLYTAPPLDYGFYARAQRECADPDDPYSVEERWRPARSQPVHAGWLRAVLEGHRRVDRRLDIRCPVQVLMSARSVTPLRWSAELTRADTVLDVESTAHAATKLGPSVTLDRIDGALHDVFLSHPSARREAYARVDRWVRGWAAALGPVRASDPPAASASGPAPARPEPGPDPGREPKPEPKPASRRP